MQIVFLGLGDNLYETLNLYFLGQMRKISSICHLLNLPIAW